MLYCTKILTRIYNFPGVFETPTINNIKRISKPMPIHIICDNVRVPGNLGAILRIAVGVGCESVYLMKGYKLIILLL